MSNYSKGHDLYAALRRATGIEYIREASLEIGFSMPLTCTMTFYVTKDMEKALLGGPPEATKQEKGAT